MITIVVAQDISLKNAMIVYVGMGVFSSVITLLLPQDTTGLKLNDHVDRSAVEMNRYLRNSGNGNEDSNENKIEELNSGMRGKLQQLKAYTFNPSKK